jgi:hypothetical protein
MEKKVNKMVELALQSEAFRKHLNQPQEDKYLMGSQSEITKEDLDQLAEWARNQIPANLENNQVEDSE